MSFDHKAFLFDEARFRAELASTLEAALGSGDLAPLRAFVDEHAARLTDPFDGGALAEGFRDALDEADVHALGDLALTAYYDPSDDVGLGGAWQDVEVAIERAGLAPARFLGARLGPRATAFDPGRMGSYFQSRADVAANLTELRRVIGARDDLDEALGELEELLATASDEETGLYVTF
jgi:hypothetical protein